MLIVESFQKSLIVEQFQGNYLNVAGLPRQVRESSSDESLEGLQSPSEDESPKLSFKSLSCLLELQLHVSAVI